MSQKVEDNKNEKLTVGGVKYEIISIVDGKVTVKNLNTKEEREYDLDFLNEAISFGLAYWS